MGGSLQLPKGATPAAVPAGYVGLFVNEAGRLCALSEDGIVLDLTPRSLGIYGDGSDGDANISVDTDLARDMYYESLVVQTGARLNAFGFRIHVRDSLTNSGVISNNGNELNGSTGVLAGGQSGGARLANGVNAGSPGASFAGHGFGGDGGAGGAAGASAGGAGGTSVHDANLGGLRALPSISTGQLGDGSGAGGGAGGGGGGSASAGANGGGGGNGGGVVVIAARIIDNRFGIIETNGENGGDAAGTGNAGGGGGGGGGLILVTYDLLIDEDFGVMQALGGAGGSPLGTGAIGVGGAGGEIITFANV